MLHSHVSLIPITETVGHEEDSSVTVNSFRYAEMFQILKCTDRKFDQAYQSAQDHLSYDN